MKKPLPEDFLLRPEIIAWCGTRERELDALSYKKFLPKIWTGLLAVLVILYIDNKAYCRKLRPILVFNSW